MVSDLQVSHCHTAQSEKMTHRESKERMTMLKNKQKVFFVDGNSGCRVHARSHFQIYKEQCTAAGIKLHHHALPRKLFRAMKQEEAAKANGQTKQQSTLDDVVVKQHSEKAANFSRTTGSYMR
jgi:hypothetical protein